MHQAGGGFAPELLRFKSKHRAEGTVAVAIATVTVDEGDADPRLFDGLAEQRLELPGAAVLQQSVACLFGKASLSAAHRFRPAIQYR